MIGPSYDESGNDEQRAMLDGLLEIGPSKPLSCIPISAILAAKSAPEIVAAFALSHGLATIKFPAESSWNQSAALYVYHRAALAAFLQARAVTVSAAGLPLQPDAFVTAIATVRFASDHPAQAIIAAALPRAVE
jgi:hypothetical protein